MGDERDDFVEVDIDPAATASCGECGTLVADPAAHRKFHRDLSREVLRSIREQARREGRR